MTNKYINEIVKIIDIIQIDSDILFMWVILYSNSLYSGFFSVFALKISPDTCLGDFRLAAVYNVKDTPTLWENCDKLKRLICGIWYKIDFFVTSLRHYFNILFFIFVLQCGSDYWGLLTTNLLAKKQNSTSTQIHLFLWCALGHLFQPI